MSRWIEEALHRRLVWSPVLVNENSKRPIYSLQFENGESGDYYINFKHKFIEEVS